jgi:alpha-beta hydrolase superfamily lysophospholipase
MKTLGLKILRGFVNKSLKSILMAIFVVTLSTCTPFLRLPEKTINTPQLTDEGFFTVDGEMLSVKSWKPKNRAKAIIISLHGFNDYSNFFMAPGTFFAANGLRSYAYDQRGFGASEFLGTWSGTRTMVSDLKTFISLVKKRHPKKPIYLLGESMGGALIIVAATQPPKLQIDGIILSAPAVWGRSLMPWYQRLVLWIGARVIPAVRLTGEGLNLKPSDNIKMLRALGRDPLVIKKTRVDAIYGLVNLMDIALDRSINFSENTLILYGEKDEIIPLQPTRLMLNRFPKSSRSRQRIAVYKDGYHMLLRDLNAKRPWMDILTWIKNNDLPFSSGADVNALKRLSDLNKKN